MKLSPVQLIALLIALTATMASCRDELCTNHFPSLDVALTWEHEWERDYGMKYSDTWDPVILGISYDDLRPGKPEWINMVCFSADGTRTESFLKDDNSSVVIDPAEGQSILFYNGDTEYIMFEDMTSLSDAKATPTSRTRATATYIMEQHPEASTTNPPDILYAAFVENIPLVANHQAFHLPVNLQPLVFTYVIRYEFEHGLEHVLQARGALGGMAKSVYLRDGHTSSDATIILYDCDVKPFGCEAHVNSFGIPGFPNEYYGRTPSDRPYTLNLEVLLANGKVLEFNFDIADQLAAQPKGGVITVRGIRLEDDQTGPAGSESGFDVDLSGWGNVNIYFPIDPDKDAEKDGGKKAAS